ncbi:hypothetical protein ADK47_06315, partial [Streptomyces rimosus subsp. rimosus]
MVIVLGLVSQLDGFFLQSVQLSRPVLVRDIDGLSAVMPHLVGAVAVPPRVTCTVPVSSGLSPARRAPSPPR